MYIRPKSEGGGTVFPMEALKKATRNVISKLPKVVVRGKELPKLLTRCDMGFIVNGKQVEPWVNEVEFVPGLYIDEQPFLIDKALGDKMVEIALMHCNITLKEIAAHAEAEE